VYVGAASRATGASFFDVRASFAPEAADPIAMQRMTIIAAWVRHVPSLTIAVSPYQDVD
jgi:hypothetical protein